jgi:hypothetical protein
MKEDCKVRSDFSFEMIDRWSQQFTTSTYPVVDPFPQCLDDEDGQRGRQNFG